MAHALGFFRKAIRLVFALFFWSHALLFYYVPKPPLAVWASRMALNPGELYVLITLGVFSGLAVYGAGKLFVDSLYLLFFPLFFPFVFLFWLGQTFFLLLRPLWRVPAHSTGAEAVSEASQLIQVNSTTVVQAIEQVGTPTPGISWKKVLATVTIPVRKFTILWCLLLVFASGPYSALLSLWVLIGHLLRAIVRMVRNVLVLKAWLPKIGQSVMSHVNGLIEKLKLIPRETEVDPELRRMVEQLGGIRTCLQVFRQWERVTNWMLLLGGLIAGFLYLYVVFLFGFVYYGIGRVQGIEFPLIQSLITALFMPGSYGRLPNTACFTLAGGFQSLFLLILGVGAFKGYLERRLESLYQAGDQLARRFQEEEIATRLDDLLAKSKKAKPSPSV